MLVVAAAQAAFHVIVDRPLPTETLSFWQQERFWVAVGAVVTALMALFTRNLAKETRDAVNTANAESDQRERHHREGLAPVLYTKLLETRLCTRVDAASKKHVYWVRLRGTLENVGPGPATTTTVHFKPFGYNLRRFPLRPIGANAAVEFEIEYPCGDENREKLNFTWPYDCAFEYSDMFGNRGWLILSGAGRSDDFELTENTPIRPFEISLPTLAERLEHYKIAD